MSKKPTQKETVLAMLQGAGPEGVTSNQFYNACLPRFAARIFELKADGHQVVKEPVEKGHFRYILVGRNGAISPPQPSPDLGRDGNTSPNLGAVDAQSPGEAEPPREVSPSSSSLPPGQLFEVDPEEHQPVSHYEWEAA